MNKFRSTYFIIAGILIALSAPYPACANSELSGELGVDLNKYTYNNNVKDTSLEFDINRSLSAHFINLNMSGPLISGDFANYAARAKMFGSYYQAQADTSDQNLYFNPDLNAYSTVLTFFPNRRYPLQLYRSRSLDRTLRYESGNRGDIELLQPSAAVVRRYQTERTSKGAALRVAASENVSILGEYKQENSNVFRDYDFDENFDIWVNVTPGLINPLNEQDTITITNEITDVSVRLLIGDHVDITMAPEEELSVVVDTGYQNVNVIPLAIYNQLNFRISINSNMMWKIQYSEPASPKDQDMVTTGFNLGVRVEKGDNFLNESSFDYSDMYEGYQNLTSYLDNFANTASLRLSRDSDLKFLTTYSANKTNVDTVSSQLSKAFSNQSAYTYSKTGGINGSVTHILNKGMTENETSTLKNTLNSFDTRVTIPTGKLEHQLDIKNTISFLSDNSGYANNQYTFNVLNRIEYDFLGIELTPKTDTKYSYGKQKNPDKAGSKFENKITLIGDITQTRYLGDIKVKGAHEFRGTYDDVGSNTKTKYIFDLSVLRKLGKSYKLMFMTNHEYETYGGSTPTPGANIDQQSPAKEPEYKASYKFDAQLMPFEEISLATNFMLITQKTVNIKKISFSLLASVPWLNLPIKSFWTKQIRDIEGLPTQSQTDLKTIIGYQFRQIAMTFIHTYAQEDLVANTYTYQQIEGKISRRFNFY